ncbi:ATP synthase F(0) complex subunit B1, mitochondrial isoform X2 [Acanthopagrus latus]|uniref:ATP synthase F(0) complex subunit B1, mitochondrial isoform X2 n=1 Tax=Acanthopagrus latus TaxID=8177 RepID=UPI00187CD0DA|nr:ATP synthase F(0) complex subunit B1, mitochondrial isoform X2 [Acanthopagrus latus]
MTKPDKRRRDKKMQDMKRICRVSAILVALCRRARRGRNKGAWCSKNLALRPTNMLSRIVIVSANALKGSGPLGAGLVQASRSLHTTSQSLAPVPPLPEKGGKVRHGIFPEEIFQLLYPKTGVTGPYMLGTGLILYMLSKEIYIINHETFAALSMGAIIIYGTKKFGPSVAAFADKLNEDKVAKAQEVKDAAMASLAQAVEDEKKEQWRVEGRSMIFDAKRNNVAMLLETNYRERLHMVTNEVKRRLDYQIALQDLHRRMEQEHMIKWVEKSVVGSITPQQEKESIAKCITDLKALAKTAQATA